MEIPVMFTKVRRELPFGIKEYRIDNPEYLDPRKDMILRQMEENNKRKHSKFKKPKITKPCFLDQRVKPIKFVPGPGTYHMQRSFTVPSLTKIMPKVDFKLKKNTYIEQLIHSEEKLKYPGVGKYDLTKSVEEQMENSKSKRRLSFGERYSNWDNYKKLASQVPGVGHYSLKFRRKVKKDMRDQEYYKEKHRSEDQRSRSKLLKPDPITYEPIPTMFKTFLSIQRDSKAKTHTSRWTHGTIDKRSSSTGFLVSPGPAQHSLINKWAKQPKNSKQNINVKLLERITKGHKPGVYH